MIQVEKMSWNDLRAEIDSLAEFKNGFSFTRIDQENQNGHFTSENDMKKWSRLKELEKEEVRRTISGNLNPEN